MTVAGDLLSGARRATGLSGRALARRARTVPARVSEIERSVHDPGVGTLDGLLRAAGWQLTALPTVAPTAAAVGSAIRALDTTDPSGEEDSFRALLVLSDGLNNSAPDLKVALCVASPPPTGDLRFDAAIAAIVDHHLTGGDLPVPAWTQEPGRYLTDPWVPDPYAGPDIAREAPAAFRKRGVLLAERELEST